MAEPADVQAHWTRPGVLARIDAALTELGHDPQNLNPEILATVEHLHSGGLATTRDQAKRIAVTEDTRVLDVGCRTAARRGTSRIHMAAGSTVSISRFPSRPPRHLWWPLPVRFPMERT